MNEISFDVYVLVFMCRCEVCIELCLIRLRQGKVRCRKQWIKRINFCCVK